MRPLQIAKQPQRSLHRDVVEAVSIEIREPDEEKVRLPDKMIVTADASDQIKPRQKVGEKRP